METWNLQDLLGSRTVNEILTSVQSAVEEFVKCREELTHSITAARVLELVKLKERIMYDLGSVSQYYGLKFTENTKDEEALAAMTMYEQLGTEIANNILFFSLWVIHLDENKAQELITSEELADYKYYFTELRKEKDHTKSEEIEQILNLKNMTGGSTNAELYDIFTNGFVFNLDDKKELSQEELRSYFHHKDSRVRQKAYEVYLERYKEEGTLLGQMYKNIVLDWYNEGIKIRGYKEPLSIRGVKNDIEDEAVKTLIAVVRENASMFAEYFKLKHELNCKYGETYEFSRHHLYAPFSLSSDEKISYEESKRIVLEAFKGFDERMHSCAQEVFDKGHVHSHPQKNKRSGAFCSSLGRRTTPYVLLNHTDKIRDVFTMMHELGHAIHSILAFKQPDMLVHASLPMAETASIFSETILVNKLLEESTNKNEKISMLIQQIDDRYASIVRQVFFVLFEVQAHDLIRAGATKQELDKVYHDLLHEQFGEMEVPEVFSYEWSYVPHMFATPFYCYAYAWGNLLALSLYASYAEDEQYKEKIMRLLSHGGSMSPQDMLAEIGVDAQDKEFWQKGFDIIGEQIAMLKELSQKKA